MNPPPPPTWYEHAHNFQCVLLGTLLLVWTWLFCKLGSDIYRPISLALLNKTLAIAVFLNKCGHSGRFHPLGEEQIHCLIEVEFATFQ